jgi:hypothetical protein
MPEGIQLLDLPQAAIGEIQGGQFVYMVTPEGQPFKVDIAEMVAKMQADAGCGCVLTAKLFIPSAEVLQLNTTPKAFGLNVPAGYYAQPLRLSYQLNFGTSDYDTNTDIAVIGSVSSVNIITNGAGLLAASSNTFLYDILGSGMSNTSTPMDGEDLLVTEPTGNPLNGDSDITLYLTYMLIEI